MKHIIKLACKVTDIFPNDKEKRGYKCAFCLFFINFVASTVTSINNINYG